MIAVALRTFAYFYEVSDLVTVQICDGVGRGVPASQSDEARRRILGDAHEHRFILAYAHPSGR